MNESTQPIPLPTPAERFAALVDGTPAERVAALADGHLDDPSWVVGMFCGYVAMLDMHSLHDQAVEQLRELARLVRGGDR